MGTFTCVSCLKLGMQTASATNINDLLESEMVQDSNDTIISSSNLNTTAQTSDSVSLYNFIYMFIEFLFCYVLFFFCFFFVCVLIIAANCLCVIYYVLVQEKTD